MIFHDEDWIAGVDYNDGKKMMTNNTIMKKPKMINARKKSKNKNRLTLMISSLMQERITILSYMGKNNKQPEQQNQNSQIQLHYLTRFPYPDKIFMRG